MTELPETRFTRVDGLDIAYQVVGAAGGLDVAHIPGWVSHLEVTWELPEFADRFRGVEVDTAGDGFFATFDGPARAIRCACAAREAVREIGVEIRAGLHTGEVEHRGTAAAGLAVHVGARVASLAQASEVLVTNTVKMLVLGSGIGFADRGLHQLKGVPDEWPLYAVEHT